MDRHASQQRVQPVEAQHVHRDRNRSRQHDGELADVRLVLDVESGNMQTDARRGDRGEQWQVPVAPSERTIAVVVQ